MHGGCLVGWPTAEEAGAEEAGAERVGEEEEAATRR